MTIRDAFSLGWMLGSAFSCQHRKDRYAIDFPEAMRRFDEANEKSGISKGPLDPVFGYSIPGEAVER